MYSTNIWKTFVSAVRFYQSKNSLDAFKSLQKSPNGYILNPADIRKIT